MSRTKRRKDSKDDYRWLLSDWMKMSENAYTWVRVPMDPTTKEYAKTLAMYHSDVYRNFKEPGPAWYRLYTVERPQRRKAKRELQKYMLNEEHEVILNPKDPLEYWT